jgi:serine/threonine protein kinase
MPATIPLLQEGRYSIEREFPYVENCFLFQAYDTQNETPVTIVEVPVRLPKVATAAQREAVGASFAEQARILIGFTHKSVVPIRSYFTEAGRNYLVTDRVGGVDLGSVLADQKQPFTIAQITGWADTLLDALNVMHNFKPALVYRNLRPENIMLREDGDVDLIASGMVSCGDQGPANAGGSPLAYSPLEQIWGGLDAASQKVIINKYDESSEKILKQELDARSDVYSLGATLYHLVTGQVPVDALERSIEIIEGNADPLKSPNKLFPSIPVEVADVIMKAMEVRREYRFDSAAIMRQVLKTALVRVREREVEEGLIQTVEQHDVRPAVQNAPPAEPKKVYENAAEAQKRREAEERVFEAERRIADAEKKRREAVVAKTEIVTETFNLAELEDDVLGILSPAAHISEPPQGKITPAANPVVAAQKAEKAPETPAPLITGEPPAFARTEKHEEEISKVVVQEQSPETVLVHTPELDRVESSDLEKLSQPEPVKEVVKPAPAAKAAAAFASYGETEMFTERKSGKGFGLPAVAGAAVLLCIVAIGGWFYFGSKPAPAAATETPSASQPAEEQPVKTAFQQNDSPAAETTAEPVTDQSAVDPNDQLSSQDQPQKVASTGSPRAKRSAPAPNKAPAQKKAVTVDDLINDN